MPKVFTSSFYASRYFDITAVQAFQEKSQAVQTLLFLQHIHSLRQTRFYFWKTFSPFKNFTSLIYKYLKNILENFANS